MTTPVVPGEVLDGKYRVERVIGTGGMGVVVAATHLELGQLVAMKFVLAAAATTPEVAVRFVREARAAARIPSEHVARVLDVGRLPTGLPYIVMEYLDGYDLDTALKQGPLSVEDAADYVIQACDAMAAAHRLGIVHRDLKPANLFLARLLDGSAIIKVLDFGISKNAFDTGAAGLTNAGALVGSPLYMSPEQMRSAKDVDARSDIWSLGAVLFELLAGRPPFTGDSVPALVAEITLHPPAPLWELRPDLPEPLVAAVLRCLEKDPNQRFHDVAELASALLPFAPVRAQLSVERMHRIVGSVPPPAQRSSTPPAASLSSGPPAANLSSSPAAVRTGSGSAPSLLRRPEELGSFAAAATAAAVGQGTAPGWTGTEAPRANKPRGWLGLAAAGVGLLVAGGVAVGLRSMKASPALETEPSVAARPVPPPPAETTAAPAPPKPEPPVVSASVAASASAAPSAEPPSEPSATAVPRHKPTFVPAPQPSATAPVKRNGLTMKLK